VRCRKNLPFWAGRTVRTGSLKYRTESRRESGWPPNSCQWCSSLYVRVLCFIRQNTVNGIKGVLYDNLKLKIILISYGARFNVYNLLLCGTIMSHVSLTEICKTLSTVKYYIILCT